MRVRSLCVGTSPLIQKSASTLLMPAPWRSAAERSRAVFFALRVWLVVVVIMDVPLGRLCEGRMRAAEEVTGRFGRAGAKIRERVGRCVRAN